jgi:hypothetical protein
VNNRVRIKSEMTLSERQGEALTQTWESRALTPASPEPPDGLCEGPSVEPAVGLVLLGAWTDGVPEVLCADEAIWPRVLTPDDGALASDADVAVPPVDKV